MVDQRRAQTIAALNQAAQRPASVAGRTLMATLFAGHPYAADPQGTREDLAKLTPDLLKKRAAAVLLRNGLTVAAVGDISEAELARQIDSAFGNAAGRHIAGITAAMGASDQAENGASSSARCRRVPALMALPGIPRDDPDWYAALVMNHVLGGGGQQSRLFNEVREKRGLAYSVSSGLRTYKSAALLVISTGSANERVAEAIQRDQGRDGAPQERWHHRAGTHRCQDLSHWVRWPCRSTRRARLRACCIRCRLMGCRRITSPGVAR